MNPVEAVCSDARYLLESQKYEAAFEATEIGLRLYPENGQLWETRGIALWWLDQLPHSMASLEMASTLTPLSPSGQLALAGCYLRTDYVESAKCIYEYLATRKDLSAELLADLAYGLGQVGDLPLALDTCREVVRQMPDCADAWIAMAFYMAALEHQPEEVAAVLKRAFETSPNPTLARIDFALLLARSDHLDQAYQLLCQLPLDDLLSVRCPPRLDRLVLLFRHMADDARARACEAQSLRLREQHP